MTNSSDRAAYTAGLRQLADVLDAHPEVPLPFEGTTAPLMVFFLTGENTKEEVAAAVRAFPCNFTKDASDNYFRLRGRLAGLGLQLTANRDEVCERVQVGETTVTEKVKDPVALAAVPEVEVTKTVPIYKWECRPVMAADQPKAVA